MLKHLFFTARTQCFHDLPSNKNSYRFMRTHVPSFYIFKNRADLITHLVCVSVPCSVAYYISHHTWNMVNSGRPHPLQTQRPAASKPSYTITDKKWPLGSNTSRLITQTGRLISATRPQWLILSGGRRSRPSQYYSVGWYWNIISMCRFLLVTCY